VKVKVEEVIEVGKVEVEVKEKEEEQMEWINYGENDAINLSIYLFILLYVT
jgi:hypothetical protein